MAVTIRYGLPGASLDEYVAEYLRESRQNPATVWMILPVNRLAETIRKCFSTTGTSCISSHVLTVSAFAETIVAAACPAIRILSSLEQHLIISQIVLGNPKMLSFFPEKEPSLSSIENLVSLYNTLRYRCTKLPDGGDKLSALASVF
ncbi:MAG: hypothetical protein LBU24_01260, partial [Methanocalculaceae archaeon]|nr:hypothetical protein [Methanocalculaceae archaeon]